MATMVGDAREVLGAGADPPPALLSRLIRRALLALYRARGG